VVGVDVGCAVVNHQCLILFLQESNNIIKWLMLALKNKRGNYVFKILNFNKQREQNNIRHLNKHLRLGLRRTTIVSDNGIKLSNFLVMLEFHYIVPLRLTQIYNATNVKIQ
jgi:hypothetical protein